MKYTFEVVEERMKRSEVNAEIASLFGEAKQQEVLDAFYPTMRKLVELLNELPDPRAIFSLIGMAASSHKDRIMTAASIRANEIVEVSRQLELTLGSLGVGMPTTGSGADILQKLREEIVKATGIDPSESGLKNLSNDEPHLGGHNFDIL